MLSLAGRRAVVTGGSRGIGLAIAQRLAAEGAACVLVGRFAGPGADPAAAVGGLPAPAGGQAAHGFVRGSAADAGLWEEVVGRYDSKRGEHIDILVNAAGIAQNSLLFKTEVDDVRNVLDTNLLATALGCRALGKRMVRRKEGCIINVSSLLASKSGTGAAVYAASKAGILGLTSALSVELGRFGVRVNALVPGYIDTQMTKGLKMDDTTLAGRIPLGRMGTVEEVADAAAFLAKNPYANNCVLNLDGGLSAA